MEDLIAEKTRKVDDSKVVNSSRNPRCAHCRNHGVQTTLKGHKAYCPYRNCNCGLCQLVRMRQKVMAKNVALRRRQELDKIKMQEIMQARKNNSVKEANGMSSKMSGEKDGDKSNSEPESESSSGPAEGSHISALALIILNFYNNDPKIAMDSIKKVAVELSSLINSEPISSNPSHSIQHVESLHLNPDIERTVPTTANGMFPPLVPGAFTSGSKKVILPATPSVYLSSFHPFALKTYRSALSQGSSSTTLQSSRKAETDSGGSSPRGESKADSQLSSASESPFSIKSLTSDIQTKSKSSNKTNQVELSSSSSVVPFFGMPSHLRGTFAFPQSVQHQPFACVPFPSFHGLPPSIWSKNWCRRDHGPDLLPSQSPF